MFADEVFDEYPLIGGELSILRIVNIDGHPCVVFTESAQEIVLAELTLTRVEPARVELTFFRRDPAHFRQNIR